MKNIRGIFIALFFVSTPIVVHANIVINEIAWMGNSVSANAEWIELWNHDSESVNLTGWTLVAVDDSPKINLSGTLAANGLYLLERTNDTSVPNITADQIYSGALGNTGEHLVLKDDLGNVVDEIDAISGWPAGDNTSKKTMQRIGDTWETIEGTPRQINSQESSNDPETPPEETTQEESPTSSSNESIEQVEKINPDPIYTAKIDMPSYFPLGISVPISVLVTKKEGAQQITNLSRGKYIWSTGDGGHYEFLKNTPVNHIFYYPGTYVVTLEYYSSALKEEPDSIHRKKITIIPDSLIITDITDDQGIIIENKSTKDIDLEKWKIVYNTQQYIFPKYTTVSTKQKLSISSHLLGFKVNTTDQVLLINPENKIVKKLFSFSDNTTTDLASEDMITEQVSSKKVITIPTEKKFNDMWHEGKWYFILGGLGAIILLAYFAFHLYSERTHLLNDEE